MKTKKFDKQLATYGTAAGAVVFGAAGADASIVHTPVDLTVNIASSPFGIDFDGVGGQDFFLSAFGLSGYAGGASIMVDSRAKNLALNETIGSGGAWNTYGTLFFTTDSIKYGAFGSATPGYLGVKFESSGTKYAWVHIDSIAEDNLSFHVSEYAYEDNGGAIAAGAVPEPSSLALLAFGAVGIRALRRRYDQV